MRGRRNPARRIVSEVGAIRRLAGAEVAARYCGALLRRLRRVIAEGTLAAADAEMAGRSWRFIVDGRDVVFDGYSFGVARELYGRRPYFAAPGFGIRHGDAVLDLGANAGLFTILAARFGARVVAVEANPACLDLIRKNVRANGCDDDVEVELALVGGSSGVFGGEGRLALGTAAPPLLGVEEIVERHGLASIDFLKIDVEGAEFDVIDEAATWLSRVQRAALEVHPEHGDVARLVSALEGHGFEVALRDADLRPVERVPPPAGYLHAWRP